MSRFSCHTIYIDLLNTKKRKGRRLRTRNFEQIPRPPDVRLSSHGHVSHICTLQMMEADGNVEGRYKGGRTTITPFNTVQDRCFSELVLLLIPSIRQRYLGAVPTV